MRKKIRKYLYIVLRYHDLLFLQTASGDHYTAGLAAMQGVAGTSKKEKEGKEEVNG